MTTLTVAEIFQNLPFYQSNYDAILNQPEYYQTEVQDAVLDIWPASSKKLNLGQLLQLWFSQKWLVNQSYKLVQKKNSFSDLLSPQIKSDDLYVFHLTGNALFGKSTAKVWSVSEQRIIEVEVEEALKYYCTYRSLV